MGLHSESMVLPFIFIHLVFIVVVVAVLYDQFCIVSANDDVITP